MLETVSAWLLTYWIHSAIALGLMWLLSLRLRERHLAFEEAGWRAALFLTLLTATLQVGLTQFVDWRPLAGSVEVPDLGARVAARNMAPEHGSSLGSFEVSSERRGRASERTGITDSPAPEAAAFQGAIAAAAASVERRLDPLQLFFGGWLVVTAALLLRLALSCGLLARTLKQRTELTEGPHADRMARLCARASVPRSVALSVCRALLVPLALGLRRWEVCLPTKVAEEFEPEEQETVLAHELAHLVRRDTIWQLASRLVSYVLILQPLNLVALSRLQTLAELRCDDWAVERTGRPVTLAKCLTRVAAWRCDSWRRYPLPAMASASRSRFGSRVRRLLARSYPQPQSRVPRWLRLLAAPAVVVFVAAAPGALQLPAPPPVPAAPSEPGEPATLPAPPMAPEPSEPSAPSAAPPAPIRPAVSPRGPSSVRGFALVAPVQPDCPPPPCGGEPAPAPSPEPAKALAPTPAPPAAPAPAPVPQVSPKPDRVGVDVEAASHAAVAPAPSARVAWLAPARAPRVTITRNAPHPVLAAAPRAHSGAWAPALAVHAAHGAGSSDCDSEFDGDSDSDHGDAYDDEMEAFEEALEDEHDALEERIEDDFELLEEELEETLELAEEAAEGEFELLVEEFEDELENGVEGLEEDLEALEERLEEEEEARRDRTHRRGTERALERWERELERFESRHERELDRLVESFERDLERQWQRDFEDLLEMSLARQEAQVERRLEVAERQMEAAARRYQAEQTPENRERLLAEVREQAREAMPTEEELSAMLELRVELEPRLAEARAVQESLRPALEEWRARFAEELERLRQRQRGELSRSE